MANTLGGAGGFCAGETVVVEHQRINSAAFIFVSSYTTLLIHNLRTAVCVSSTSHRRQRQRDTVDPQLEQWT